MATDPATFITTHATGAGSVALNALCRKVTIWAMGNDTATITNLGGDILLKDGVQLVLEDRELGGKVITFGGTVGTIEMVQHLGAGA